jgi:hypothetical protein
LDFPEAFAKGLLKVSHLAEHIDFLCLRYTIDEALKDVDQTF